MPPRSGLTRILTRLRGEGGYSLMELVVVLAIMVTVVSALAGVFVAGSNAELRANNRFQAQLQARLALDKLRREVHCASTASVTTTSVGGVAVSQSLTLVLPTVPVSPTGTIPCSTGVGTFTWCTVGSGKRWQLVRIAGSTCTSSGAREWADYLTSGVIFPSPTFTAPTATTLGTLHVSMRVNITPTKPGSYKLIDDLVLRNSVRTA